MSKMNATEALDPDTYLRHAQIIQGVLIFLSACVGVTGYAVQARLRARERLEEVRLERTRLQISEFVGPLSQLVFNFAAVLMMQLVPKHLIAKSGFTGTHIVTRKNFYDLAGETMERHNKTHDGGWDTMKLMRGGSNILMNTFVGFELEDLMSKKPRGEIAQAYMRFIRQAIKNYGIPASELIQRYGQTLQERPSLEFFKEKYPQAGKSPMARNLFYTMFLEWVFAFQRIIEDWDRDDFSIMYPQHVLCPISHLNSYLMHQLTELRKKEEALGSMDHNTEKNVKKGAWHGIQRRDELVRSLEEHRDSALKPPGKYTVSNHN